MKLYYSCYSENLLRARIQQGACLSQAHDSTGKPVDSLDEVVLVADKQQTVKRYTTEAMLDLYSCLLSFSAKSYMASMPGVCIEPYGLCTTLLFSSGEKSCM